MRKGDNITMSFTENFRKVLKRRTRNAKYFFQWLFTEKIRGLDFTMKKITGLEKTEEYSEHGYNGYAKSPEEVVRKALEIMNPGPEDSFTITVRNFRRLGLQKRVKVFNCRAEEFEHYTRQNNTGLSVYSPTEERAA